MFVGKCRPKLLLFLMVQKESAYARRINYSRARELGDLSNTDEIEELSQNTCESCITLKEVSVKQKTSRAEEALMRSPTRRRCRVQMLTAIAQRQNPRKTGRNLKSTERMCPGPGGGLRPVWCGTLLGTTSRIPLG